ncbi:MAG: hypothetical protein J0M11_01490 [Anaerolineae bacterium]|nr:hypothetical protein [Anaerolineae bacterium]
MDKVTGSAYQTTNVRSAPKVVDTVPTNRVAKLYKDETFTGEIVISNGEKWIKLVTVKGVPVTGAQYVASWVVNSTVVVTTPPTEEPSADDPFVSAEVTTASGQVHRYNMVKL